jgi:CSLREA domain-containing protein
MQPRFWRAGKAAALAAVVLIGGAACVAPPQPNAALVVNTTANTFDGTCDVTNCSLRDAVAASNALVPVGGVPNQITVPAGNYSLGVSSPIEILKPVIISGAGAALSTLDITGSTVAAPGGVFDAKVALVMNGLAVTSSNSPAADVLASCTGHDARTVSLLNVVATGLAATVAECDTAVVNSVVTGPTTALDPFALSVSNSTVPFATATIDPVRFTLVSATVTGPTTTSGTTQNAVLSIQPPGGQVNIPVNITTSRLVGVGLQLGGVAPGSIAANALSTSFGQTGSGGPVSLTVGAGSTAKLVNSTVYGGGAAGALIANGTLTLESVTATTNGPTIVRGAGGTVNLRRSIVGATSGAACSAPATSLGRNLVVGTSCGTSTPTDQTVANEAALGLGALDLWGNPTPSLHRLPLTGSPALNAIPAGPVTDLDCPTDASGGRSIDARGVRRPQGTGCDIGALEVEVVAPPA